MKSDQNYKSPILLKLRCGHIVGLREYRKNPWCPFCGLEDFTPYAKESVVPEKEPSHDVERNLDSGL